MGRVGHVMTGASVAVCVVFAVTAPATAAPASDPLPQLAISSPQPGDSTVVLDLTSSQGAAGLNVIHALARQTLPSGSAGAGAESARRSQLASVAPDADQFAAVARFVDANHLRVTAQDQWSVTLSAPASVLAPLFDTTLTPISYPNATGTIVTGAEATSPLVIPPSLAGVVVAAVGLDDAPTQRPSVLPSALPSGNSMITPGWLTAHYGGLANTSIPADGHGTTVGIVSFAANGFSPSDFAAYTAALGTSAPLPTYRNVDGTGAVATSTATENVETMLDTEAVAGVAPSAHQVLYTVQNSDAGQIAAWNAMATDAT